MKFIIKFSKSCLYFLCPLSVQSSSCNYSAGMHTAKMKVLKVTIHNGMPSKITILVIAHQEASGPIVEEVLVAAGTKSSNKSLHTTMNRASESYIGKFKR